MAMSTGLLIWPGLSEIFEKDLTGFFKACHKSQSLFGTVVLEQIDWQNLSGQKIRLKFWTHPIWPGKFTYLTFSSKIYYSHSLGRKDCVTFTSNPYWGLIGFCCACFCRLCRYTFYSSRLDFPFTANRHAPPPASNFDANLPQLSTHGQPGDTHSRRTDPNQHPAAHPDPNRA
jgi:hypothetical protein